MKTIFKTIIIAIFTITLVTSCKNDEVIEKPSFSDMEIGKDNSKQAYIGDELHVEGNINAPGKIKTVQLTIHPEDEHEHEGEEEHGWELDTIYTKFDGLKNSTLHEHIDISAEAEEGEYHLHLIVVDYEGNTASIEEHIDIIAKP